MESKPYFVIQDASVQDVRAIVAIHQDAFPGFFLTCLGADFLSLYYKSFLSEPDSVCLVAKCKGVLIGFSVTANKSRGFNLCLVKKHLFSFVLMAVKILFTRPKAILRLLKNLSKRVAEKETDSDYAELYSIGVQTKEQGKGIGKQLLKETEAKLKDKGIKRLSLTTDCDNNDTAIGFYTKQGFDVLYEFETYPNRKMYRMIKSL